MRKLFLFLLAITLYNTAYCQFPGPVIQWEKSLGGTTNEEAYATCQTLDGGYMVVGPTQSGTGQISGHHSNESNYDYWVVKLDSAGAIQWQECLGGSDDDVAWSVQQTADSGYIITGSSESGDGDLSTSNIEEYNYWTVKLSPTGTILWKSCFGSNGGAAFSESFSVKPTLDGNYIVAGFTNSADSGEVTGFHGNDDYWVVKVSATGNFLWGKCLGGSALDLGQCVQPTTDGGYIVAGESNSTDGQVTGNHGGYDYWVVKLDDTGGLQWEKSLGGTGDDIAYSICQTYDGGYVVAGTSNSTDGDVTGNHGGDDYWVVKLSGSGAIEWEQSLGGSGDEIARSVMQTNDSAYIVTGNTNSPVSGNVTQSFGNDDYWLVKLSRYGTLQWQKSFGGSGTDDAFGIQQTPDSGYIVTGGSNSTDSEVTGNHGAYDFWEVKLSKCMLDSPTTMYSHTTGIFSITDTATYISYQWFFDTVAIPGATNATFNGLVGLGGYSVHVIDSNICVGFSKPYYIYEGINNVVNNNAIMIIPNPTGGTLNIIGAGLVNIRVYNTLGQLLKEADNAKTISIAEYPDGLYFIKLTNDQGTLSYEQKVLKE